MNSILRTLSCAALATTILASSSPATAAGVPNFALVDVQDVNHELFRSKGRAVVLFFTGVGCPIVKKNARKFRDLRDEFAGKGIEFWVVNSFAGDEKQEVRKEQDKLGLRSMTILLDSKQAVALALGVDRTAEAVAIDLENQEIFYRGAIDDQLSEGAEKPEASRHFLKNALEAFLQGQEIEVAKTKARGCRITYAKVTEDDAAPDYSTQVAPLLQDNCVTCHRKGGIGPWSMNSHRRVSNYADMIEEVLLTRRMPPWDPHPAYGKFKDPQSISREDTQTLLRWVQAGAPGPGSVDPLEAPLPDPPDWRLGEPDVVLKLPELQSVPPTGVLDYRYIEVENPFKEDVWISGMDIKPDNRKVVHHIILYVNKPGVHGRGEKGEFFVGWAPGASPLKYEEGIAKKLPADAKLTFEMHYTTCGTEEVDQSEIALYLADGPAERIAETRQAINWDLNIPPGESEAAHSATYHFDQPATLYGLFPHMHFRGKWMKYELLQPDGKRETLLHVPRYDFQWQFSYYLEEPRHVPAGSWLIVTGAFDNSADNPANPDPNKRVIFGEQSWDEMFIGFFEAADDPAPTQTAKK
jgi:peroxiredoxin/mono/diheme cytochrome c family protein